MKTADFNYDLPERLIAQVPLEERTDSRLMVVNRSDKTIAHRKFKDIIDYLEPGDCLVVNNTRVLPARLIGQKADTGAKVELLLLKRISQTDWEVLVKPGKKVKVGTNLTFGNGQLTATVEQVVSGGNRIVRFGYDGIFEEVLDQLGTMPLPPYIRQKLEDKERYQTVYSKHDGSAAAPTAGLHFSEDLLEQIRQKGVQIANVTLHVGLGTFRPVKVEDVKKHTMHSEFCFIQPQDAALINQTKQKGGRIISVGTTSLRALESFAQEDGMIQSGSMWTDIFIYPPYRFKVVDKLITNFHLPASTLLMLVSAFGGKEFILDCYEQAINQEYRLFSFGDAMLIQ